MAMQDSSLAWLYGNRNSRAYLKTLHSINTKSLVSRMMPWVIPMSTGDTKQPKAKGFEVINKERERELVKKYESLLPDALKEWIPEEEVRKLAELLRKFEALPEESPLKNSAREQISLQRARIENHPVQEKEFFFASDELQKIRVARALANGPIDTVIGPLSLSQHWNEETKMMVYIFGDHHNRQPLCERVKKHGNHVSIADFFEVVLRRQPQKVIDIFLEMPFVKDDISDNNVMQVGTYEQGYLAGEVKIQWRSCLKKQKTECQQRFPNLRMHYTDTRFVFMDKPEGRGKLISTFNGTYDGIVGHLEDLISASEERHPDQIIAPSDSSSGLELFVSAALFARKHKKYSDSKDDHAYRDKLAIKFKKPANFVGKLLLVLTLIWNVLRWDKKNNFHPITQSDLELSLSSFGKESRQLENIPNENLRNRIDKFIRTDRLTEWHELTLKFYTDICYLIRDFICAGKVMTPEKKKELLSSAGVVSITVPHSYAMDLYTMGRLFRTFSDKDNKRQSVQHALIYVGDDHAESYRKLLTTLGFKQIDRIGSSSRINNQFKLRCISLDSFTQPFFTPPDAR